MAGWGNMAKAEMTLRIRYWKSLRAWLNVKFVPLAANHPSGSLAGYVINEQDKSFQHSFWYKAKLDHTIEMRRKVLLQLIGDWRWTLSWVIWEESQERADPEWSRRAAMVIREKRKKVHVMKWTTLFWTVGMASNPSTYLFKKPGNCNSYGELQVLKFERRNQRK